MPPRERSALTRSALPDALTAETLRELPLSTLRRLADHRNGILTRDEQQAFDKIMHEVMRGTAERVSRQLNGADWAAIRRDERSRGERPSKTDLQLRRMARRIGQQVEVAAALAPGVDWSFARADDAAPIPTPPSPAVAIEATETPNAQAPRDSSPPDDTADADGTVSDLEARISEQVELVEVMSEIAEMSKRTFALEQQRDLQNVRSVFFGFVVSVAVLVGGWAPLVTAKNWNERAWMVGLTFATLLLAGGVYWLVRQREAGDNSAKAS